MEIKKAFSLTFLSKLPKLKVIAPFTSDFSAMGKDKTTINLLPKQGEGLVTQFLAWALTVGRLLIILTETLALGTFLYRFGLDMKIVDLHDQIKANSFIVKSFAPSEKIYRNLQNRLAIAKKYDGMSGAAPAIFNDIIEYGRGKITFQNILVSTDIIKVQVQAPSASALSAFVTALKKYPAIQSLSIDLVEDKTSTALITVSITGYLRKL